MLLKRSWYCFAALFFLFHLTACDKPVYTQPTTILNLPAEVTIYSDDKDNANKALAEIKLNIARINHLLGRETSSQLSQLNNAITSGKPTQISQELKTVIEDITRISNQHSKPFIFTDGYLLDIWGFNSPNPIQRLPDEKLIQEFLKITPNISNISLDNNLLKTTDTKTKLDLDGFDKGYALDQLISKLQTHSIKSALININNNVMVIGEKETRPWKVGIQHPRKPGPIATLELNDQESLINAVDYERYFTLNGKRYNHIMDPTTGYPVQSVQSVSILGEKKDKSNAELGALAKILFIAGAEKFFLLTKQHGIKNAMLIDAEGKVYITPSLARKIEFKLPKPIIQEE